MATANDVYTLVRALLNDTQQDWSTDAVLLPYVQSAYREVARLCRTQGMAIYRKIAAVSGIAGTTTSYATVGRATTPAYASDLIWPVTIREKLSSAAFNAYTPMGRQDDLPRTLVNSKAEWSHWVWVDDTIYLPPVSAVTNRDLLILYEAQLADIASSATTLRIQDSVDAIAYLACSAITKERGQAGWMKEFEDKGQQLVGQLVADEAAATKRATTPGFGGNQ